MTLFFQIILALFFIFLGGFFAGSETGVYKLSPFKLRVGTEQGRPFFAVLNGIMADTHGLVLAMLIGTNLSYYIATSIVTFMFFGAVGSPHKAELYATVLMTPTLFVFAELIPKNIYFHRCDYLMPKHAPVIWFFYKLFTFSGILGFLEVVSAGFRRLLGSPVQDKNVMAAVGRNHIQQIIQESAEEGYLSTVQHDIINRLAQISGIRLGAVMVPLSKVEMIDVNSDRKSLLNKLRLTEFSRLLVYENSRKNILGFINICRVLAGKGDFKNLRDFVQPIDALPGQATVTEAINTLRNKKHNIALVTQRKSRRQTLLIGIVTIKDLVEELTGELAQW